MIIRNCSKLILFIVLQVISPLYGQQADPRCEIECESLLELTFNATVPGAGFDTGIAISNPTSAAGMFLMRFIPVGPPVGDLTDPDVITFVEEVDSSTLAANRIGNGLLSDGRLPARSLYTVLVSQLLELFHIKTQFVGKVEIETTFPDARALNFIVDSTRGDSQGYQAMPLQSPSTNSRTVIIHTFWGRGFARPFQGSSPQGFQAKSGLRLTSQAKDLL